MGCRQTEIHVVDRMPPRVVLEFHVVIQGQCTVRFEIGFYFVDIQRKTVVLRLDCAHWDEQQDQAEKNENALYFFHKLTISVLL